MAVLGTKSESIFMERIFTVTGTWTPAFSCRAYVTVIGPGGSGGQARTTTDHEAMAASGGGAGGCAKSLLTLSSSVTYTITIGAGGATASGSGGSNGSAGGASSEFTGSDITDMAGAVGSGGLQSSDTDAISLAGGAGGAATGGNIWNVTGGAGGSASSSGSWLGDYGSYYMVGGGGAAGILGEAFRGGNASTAYTGYDTASYAGGAGVGGRGGDATAAGEQSSAMASGGCADRAGADAVVSSNTTDYGPWSTVQTTTIALLNSSNYQYVARLPINAGTFKHNSAESRYHTMKINQGQTSSIFHGLTGQAGQQNFNNNKVWSGPGAGGSSYWPLSSMFMPYTVPGIFGGGGGSSPSYYGAGGSTSVGYGAAGSFGAGGGGVGQYSSSSNTSYSGAGGNGMVVVTILEVL